MSSNEWFTPSKYIEAARQVMGSIDLDPASCMEANQIVKAAAYFTQSENGLILPWHGNVWCNPPFSITPECRTPQPTWTMKLMREYEQGNIKQAILLVKADTKNPWMLKLLDYMVCLPLRRIHFIRPGKKPQELREGIVLAYFGWNEQRFIEVFSKYGRIAKAVDTPKPKPINLDLWQSLDKVTSTEDEATA